MKCFVTGGAGFIGSHLVERLLNDHHSVSVIDNFSTGHVDNLSHLEGHPSLNIFEGDLNDQEIMRKASEGAEWVFHLAALADIVPSIERPSEYTDANVRGTISVLEAARTVGAKRFIYAASSSCYGIPDVYPTPESAEARPQYPYALAKHLGEQCVMHWQQLYGLPCVSLRMFNIFGPRSRTSGTYGAVFGVFLAQKLAGKPFTIVGDGTQTRDFTYVTDAVDAYVKAAESDIVGEIMNIGSGDTYSINRLVELLGGEAVYIPKRPGEPDCTFADTTRIKELLNWHPKVSFEEGVAKMIENIGYWREAPVWTSNTIAEATESWFKYLGNKDGATE
jgi:UDP-glucose 4-epimerase